MHRALLVLAMLLIPGTSSADKGLKKVEIDTDELTYFTDGRGHYLAVAMEKYEEPVLFYSGRGKVFHLQELYGRAGYKGRSGRNRTWSFWSPQSRTPGARHGYHHGHLSWRYKEKFWQVRCGLRKTKVFKVDEKKARQLRRARYLERKHKRMPHLLARDDRGVYYYVDRYQKEYGGGNYRLFVGKSGAMKPLRLKQLISDEVGDVFETPKGTLVRNERKKFTHWRPRRGKPVDVFVLSLRNNDYQIYGLLGIYKERLGTPCDDL